MAQYISAVPNERRVSWSELAVLALVTAVSGVLRGVWLEEYPSGIHVDEAAMALLARDVLQGTGPHPLSFAFVREPALFIHAEAWLMALLGGGMAPIRALAAVAGTLTVPAVWWLARQGYGPAVGLVAAGLVGFTSAHIHFSRQALNIIEIPLFGVVALAAAWRGVATGRLGWHAVAGLALAVDQFAAFGSRLWIFVLAGAYAILLIANRRAWRGVATGGAVAAATFALVMLPMVVHNLDQPSLFWDRVQARSVFRRWDQATEIHGTTSPVGVMLGQVKINLLAYVSEPDRGTFYEFSREPLFFEPVGALFFIGLAMALWRAWRPENAVLLLAFAGVLSGGVLSAASPQFQRLVLALPVACVLAAVAAVGVANALSRWLARDAAMRERVGGWLLGTLLVATALDGADAVFRRHPATHPWQPATAWARWAGGLPGDAEVLVAGGDDLGAADERIRYLASGASVKDLANPTVELPGAVAAGRDVVIGLSPKLDDWVPLLQFQLPGMAVRPVTGPDGDLLLYELRGAGGEWRGDGGRGLRGELVVEGRGAGAALERLDPAVAFREASRLSAGAPFRATWAGTLTPPAAGLYRLEVFTDGGVDLLLGGRSVVQGRPAPEARSLRADVPLGREASPIELRYVYQRGRGTLELRWRPPDGQRTVIPPTALRPA
ncbi:MAG: glycosyltransferase family 39 protein [Chloroflexota bacterium]